MASSNAKPLAALIVGLLAFLAVDYTLFRQPVLAGIIPPVTTSMKAAHLLKSVKAPVPQPKEVLVLGNSKMEFAFWAKLADAQDPTSEAHFTQGAISGSTEKWSYYLLKYLDPKQNRYAAIVVGNSEYKVKPAPEDFENDLLCARSLVPFVQTPELPSFLHTFTDPRVREQAEYQALFPSHGAGIEILTSGGRVLQRIAGGGVTRLLTDEGHPETVEALAFQGDQIITLPPHFDSFMATETQRLFERPSAALLQSRTQRNADFHRHWLTSLARLYSQSSTKIIIVNMPQSPFPLPEIQPAPNAPDIRQSLPVQPNLVTLDENNFEFLQRPRYFYDCLHLNREGRRLFTTKLAADVLGIIAERKASGGAQMPATSQ